MIPETALDIIDIVNSTASFYINNMHVYVSLNSYFFLKRNIKLKFISKGRVRSALASQLITKSL